MDENWTTTTPLPQENRRYSWTEEIVYICPFIGRIMGNRYGSAHIAIHCQLLTCCRWQRQHYTSVNVSMLGIPHLIPWFSPITVDEALESGHPYINRL